MLSAPAAEYTVIVSKSTMQDAAWSKVVDALVAKHQGEVMTFGDSPLELKKALGGPAMPRWICWVARPQDLGALPAAGPVVAPALRFDRSARRRAMETGDRG
jgi:hypothetical protein